MSGPEGWCANGSFDASLLMSRAGQIMISHLNGNFRAIAARRAGSLTSAPTTNVPTAPMLMISNLANCFAMIAGWHRLVPPTFTARRNTTQRIRGNAIQDALSVTDLFLGLDLALIAIRDSRIAVRLGFGHEFSNASQKRSS